MPEAAGPPSCQRLLHTSGWVFLGKPGSWAACPLSPLHLWWASLAASQPDLLSRVRLVGRQCSRWLLSREKVFGVGAMPSPRDVADWSAWGQ